MKFARKIASAIATGAVILQLVATPALADTTLSISGNGSGSNNNLDYKNSASTTVTQQNTATITNTVNANGNTGGNEASKNTNGDVSVSTGDAKAGVQVTNTANSNAATVACCSGGDTLVKIMGNGADSNNSNDVAQTKTTLLDQANQAKVTNTVNANAKTGANEANKNTGPVTGGDPVSIDTGNATVASLVANTLNNNAASVAGCCGGDTKAVISGNGSGSKNDLDLTQTSSDWIKQGNNAGVTNTVNANAKTGANEANKNTGGSVSISTGNAAVSAEVDTTANANVATIGSGLGSVGSVMLAIDGNGSGSDNSVDATLGNNKTIFQGNSAEVNNIVNANAKTGKNEAEKNTGGNVSIDTGNAGAALGISNELNFNSAAMDCCALDVTGVISGNGAPDKPSKDPNSIVAVLSNLQFVTQGNGAGLTNSANANPKTGKNEAENNTGAVVGFDPVMVTTGDSTSYVNVANTGNSNNYGSVLPSDWPNFEFSFMWSWAQMMSFFGGNS